MAFPPTHGRTPNERRSKDREDQAHRAGGQIDLNHASKEDIISTTGLDGETAEQILRFRDQRGGFETWRGFDEIPIPDQDREKLRPHVAM
jgi:DNA uptake protein ComE-like DNA-binding protein